MGQEGAGVNWLAANQTKTNSPFFFTDCQTYYCRSVAPFQDTPAVKSTFTAELSTDRPNFTVLASGIGSGPNRFVQTNPVASYLFAVLAGTLEKSRTGPRTVVYAEPSMLELSVKNLAHMSDFIDIVSCGEKIARVDRGGAGPVSLEGLCGNRDAGAVLGWGHGES